MAQVEAARHHDIIDLTEGDDSEDQLVTLSAAASKAEAAASRLTSQFESLTATSKNIPVLHGSLDVAQSRLTADASRKDQATVSRARHNLAGTGPSKSHTRITSETLNSQRTLEQRIELKKGCDERSPRAAAQPDAENEEVPAQSAFQVVRLPSVNRINSAGLHTAAKEGTTSVALKRKRHSRSPDAKSPVKQARSSISKIETAGSLNHTISKRDEHASRIFNTQSGSHSLPSSTLATKILSRTSKPQLGEALAKTQRHELTDQPVSGIPASNQGPLISAQARAPDATGESGPAPAVMEALIQVFEAVVYPAIRKAKRRHRDRLPDGDLVTIGKKIAAEVVDLKLKKLFSKSLGQPTLDQRKEIKSLVKISYQQKVLSCPRLRHPVTSRADQDDGRPNNPSTSVAAFNAKPTTSKTCEAPKITNLAEYLRKLEDSTLPAELDVFQTASVQFPNSLIAESSFNSSSRSASMASADRINDDLLKGYPESLPTSPPSSVSAAVPSQAISLPSQSSAFSPEFDRGRFPAGRRRRANKYYNPTRPPRPASNAQPVSVAPVNQQARESRAESFQEVSEDDINAMLIDRVASDPEAKALVKAIADECASQEQINLFEELTNELRRSRNPGASQQLASQANNSESRSEDMRQLRSPHRQDNGRRSGNFSEHNTQKYDAPGPGPNTEKTRNPRFASSRKLPPPKTSRPVKKDGTQARLQLDPDSVMHSQIGPVVSRSPATALDPHLEHVTAVLLLNEPGYSPPANRKRRYSIDRAEQEELTRHPALFKHATRNTRQRGSQLPVTEKASFTRIETKVVDPTQKPGQLISSLLRHRELGSDSRGRHLHTHYELRLRNAERVEPWRYWKGASGDIVAAAWGPDSTTYAVGAAAHTNPEDVQYNRPCNLLLGDLIDNTLTELPHHRVDRPKPETLAGTYNARQAVYDACDPMVYETVSSLAFSSTADRLYTASHDRTVKIWDTSAKRRECLRTLHHDAKVTSVEVSSQKAGLFATGSEVIDDSVRIYYTEDSETSIPLHVGFSSSRAQARPDWKIYPECLRWGPTSYTSHLLLAGFHQNDTEEPPQEGQLCLWDANAFQFIKVIPSSQSVLAAVWHPTMPFFATGGSPGGSSLTHKHITKTVVRTWDLRSPKRYTMEYECPARDMQDITFHPADSNYVTAGCTDGTSFVWDYRTPNHPLHRLRHGKPLVDWDHTRGKREDVDTGVMMSLWGLGGSLFYTGSSDGMIKAWDVRRHPQDVLVRNVAQFGAGIQSGSFSPDGTNLLVGDADGGVHVLSSAPCGAQPSEVKGARVSCELPVTLVRAPDGSGSAVKLEDDDPGCEGRDAAKDLTDLQQLNYVPDLGVTQGHGYEGPYATYWRTELNDPVFRHSQAMKTPENKLALLRTPEENKAVEEKRRGLIKARKQRILELYAPKSAEGSVQTNLEKSNAARRDRSTHNTPMLPEGNIIPESKMVEENHWWPRLGEEEIERAYNGKGHLNFPE